MFKVSADLQFYLIIPLAKKMEKIFLDIFIWLQLTLRLQSNMSNDLLVSNKAFVRDHITVPSDIV